MADIQFQDGEQLAALLRNGIECAGKDSARPVLSSLLISMDNGVVRVVSTDSFVMLVQDYGVAGQGSTIEPVMLEVVDAKVWLKAIKRAPVSVVVDGNEIKMITSGAQLTAKAVEGMYPAYENIVPKDGDLGKFEQTSFDGRKLNAMGKIGPPSVASKDKVVWTCKLMVADKACVFDSVGGNGWQGRFIIMPVRVN